jgi:phosphoribosylaminoimidazole-succinocarboxamide synthase
MNESFFAISNTLKKRGVAFIDTKTEHGKNIKGQTVAIDELYTMDSSRFWYMDQNGGILLVDGEPVQIGKENARKIVKEKNQQFTKEQADMIAFDYIKGYQKITGKRFVPNIKSNVEIYIEGLKTVFENIL